MNRATMKQMESVADEINALTTPHGVKVQIDHINKRLVDTDGRRAISPVGLTANQFYDWLKAFKDGVQFGQIAFAKAL